MTYEQKAQVLLLHKEKSTNHSVKAISTTGSGPGLVDVSDQLAMLTFVIQTLHSNWGGG